MPDHDRIETRKADGVCVACGSDAPVADRVKCERCLAVGRADAAQRRLIAAKKRLCEACMTRKAVPGRGKRCAECADRYLARQLERARAKRKGSKT